MKRTLTVITTQLILPPAPLHAADTQAKKPNILVICADDLGYLLDNQASNQGPALEDWKLEGILPALGDRTIQFIDESLHKIPHAKPVIENEPHPHPPHRPAAGAAGHGVFGGSRGVTPARDSEFAGANHAGLEVQL
jgi:hypothetical protein